MEGWYAAAAAEAEVMVTFGSTAAVAQRCWCAMFLGLVLFAAVIGSGLV
jgi:hypothetical protein